MRGLVRARKRLLESDGRDCVERGYLLVPVWLEQMAGGDYEAGYATAARPAAIGERFGDADLVWLARDDQARALVKQGRVDEGVAAGGRSRSSSPPGQFADRDGHRLLQHDRVLPGRRTRCVMRASGPRL